MKQKIHCPPAINFAEGGTASMAFKIFKNPLQVVICSVFAKFEGPYTLESQKPIIEAVPMINGALGKWKNFDL